MRLGLPAFFPGIFAVSLLMACYSQPALSPQRPLHCTVSKMSDECPKGYACQGGLCGPTSCEHTIDCPIGLLCTNRGCVLPPDAGEPDGSFQIPNGRDGGPDAVERLDVEPAPDAPAVVDGGQD